MTQVVLVRHGATAWTGRRYCGRSDPALNEDGVAAVAALAAALAPTLPAGVRIVSSPARRARETATAIADAAGIDEADIAVDDRWLEADFGIAEGRTFDELAALAPDVADALARGETSIDWPDGEAAAALAARVEAAWMDLIDRAVPVLVVSHAGPLRHALAIARSLPPASVELIEPASAVLVEVASEPAGIGDRATLPSVTRRRSSTRGPGVLFTRGTLPPLLLPVLAMVLAAACIGQGEVDATPTPSSPPSVVSPAPSVEAPPTAEVATPVPTAEPTAIATPTEPAASDEPSASGAAGSVEACTGTDDNRTFFSKVAAAFDWPVYCAVLPARWSVATGSYRSAGGGRMEIAYKGPGGARFELHEGAFCDLPEGCVPNGPDAGTAAFGNLSGTLVTGDDGSYAIVVDRGQARSWLAVGVGLDLDTFKTFAADLTLVE